MIKQLFQNDVWYGWEDLAEYFEKFCSDGFLIKNAIDNPMGSVHSITLPDGTTSNFVPIPSVAVIIDGSVYYEDASEVHYTKASASKYKGVRVSYSKDDKTGQINRIVKTGLEASTGTYALYSAENLATSNTHELLAWIFVINSNGGVYTYEDYRSSTTMQTWEQGSGTQYNNYLSGIKQLEADTRTELEKMNNMFELLGIKSTVKKCPVYYDEADDNKLKYQEPTAPANTYVTQYFFNGRYIGEIFPTDKKVVVEGNQLWVRFIHKFDGVYYYYPD